MLQAISALLSYSSRQHNTLRYLQIVKRLLDNEKNIIQHGFIVQCKPQVLITQLDEKISDDDALLQLNWLLINKESFKALEAEYVQKIPMESPSGEWSIEEFVLFRL